MRVGDVRPVGGLAPERATDPSHGVAATRYNRRGLGDHHVVRPGY
jgi:hypothetical protein